MIQSDKFEMRLGLPGGGKTLTQNELIVLPALASGIEVYVSYWVNTNQPNYHYFSDFEEVQGVRNCVVVFDEMCHILDPRNWDKEGGSVRDFFQLHRHRHVEIYGNTQHISFIAKTALVEITKYIMCDKGFNSDIFRFLFPSFPWIVVNSTTCH